MKEKYAKLYSKQTVVSGWVKNTELPSINRAARRAKLSRSKFITMLLRREAGLLKEPASNVNEKLPVHLL
jgi:hypothetical protein